MPDPVEASSNPIDQTKDFDKIEKDNAEKGTKGPNNRGEYYCNSCERSFPIESFLHTHGCFR